MIPNDWSRATAPSLDTIESIARAEFSHLPDNFRALCGNVACVVQDIPDDDVMADLELESEFDILGLFQGADLAERDSLCGHPEPTVIILYRRPILDYWAEYEIALGELVRHVLIHEIGHHFGLSDADMEKIEEA